jgi:hydroxymethylbilane synthase
VILPREDPRDAWFCDRAASISELPSGATVGTSSLRRQAQVMALRPDVSVVNFRGNLQTRLQKLRDGQVDATMLALAGLRRMGIAADATAILSTDELLPAVAQGAVGLEMRADDDWTRGLIAAIDDAPSRLRVMTERACLEELQGSCQTPIGVLCEYTDAARAQVRLRALLAEPDGADAWRVERAGPLAEADGLARDAGRELRRRAGEGFFERHADLF